MNMTWDAPKFWNVSRRPKIFKAEKTLCSIEDEELENREGDRRTRLCCYVGVPKIPFDLIRVCESVILPLVLGMRTRECTRRRMNENKVETLSGLPPIRRLVWHSAAIFHCEKMSSYFRNCIWETGVEGGRLVILVRKCLSSNWTVPFGPCFLRLIRGKVGKVIDIYMCACAHFLTLKSKCIKF